jgi:hypothetical protein
LYFLLKYVLPPVLFTLTQVVLLLLTSTSTRVQILCNLGTSDRNSQIANRILEHDHALSQSEELSINFSGLYALTSNSEFM